jgi:hypothetical protein
LTALLVRFAAAVYWEHNVLKEAYLKEAGALVPANSLHASSPFYFGDSDTYWQLGKAIAAGKPYNYGGNYIHRMPGYPALLSPLFLLYGSEPQVFAARMENIIFGVLTVFAVVLLAQQLFHNRNISLLAGFFVALDPLQIIMSVLVLSEAPFCLFMVLQLLFFALAWNSNNSNKFTYFIFSGLMYAAAVYCRPSWLCFVPFVMILETGRRFAMMLWVGMQFFPSDFSSRISRPAPVAAVILSGTFITLIAALCLLPWWYRNYQITGHFVSTTLQAGPSLYDGLSPTATGKSEMLFAETFRDELLKEDSKRKTTFKDSLEYRLNQKLNQIAWDWAKKHPDKALELEKRKFFRLWNFFPNEESFSVTAARVAVFCSFSPVFILGLCGVIGSFRRSFDVQLLWMPAVYITALHIIFVSSIRYRCPAMLGFAILAAWFIVSVYNFFHREIRE